MLLFLHAILQFITEKIKIIIPTGQMAVSIVEMAMRKKGLWVKK
jgi:hypothetical protein